MEKNRVFVNKIIIGLILFFVVNVRASEKYLVYSSFDCFFEEQSSGGLKFVKLANSYNNELEEKRDSIVQLTQRVIDSVINNKILNQQIPISSFACKSGCLASIDLEKCRLWLKKEFKEKDSSFSITIDIPNDKECIEGSLAQQIRQCSVINETEAGVMLNLKWANLKLPTNEKALGTHPITWLFCGIISVLLNCYNFSCLFKKYIIF